MNIEMEYTFKTVLKTKNMKCRVPQELTRLVGYDERIAVKISSHWNSWSTSRTKKRTGSFGPKVADSVNYHR